MITPPPRDASDDFVARQASLDDRLEDAFERYDDAFQHHSDELVQARLNLSLLLWTDEDPPREVEAQLELDGEELLRETPPL